MYFSLWDLMKQAFIYFIFRLIVPNLGHKTQRINMRVTHQYQKLFFYFWTPYCLQA